MATSSHTPGNDDNTLSQSSHKSRMIRLSYGPETVQFGELHLPAGSGPFPTVILIHGGFWRNPNAYSDAWARTVQLVRQLVHLE